MMPHVEVCDGDRPMGNRAWTGVSADGTVRAMALVDGAGSWDNGAEVAELCFQALGVLNPLPVAFDRGDLIRVLANRVGHYRDPEGSRLSVMGVTVRGCIVRTFAGGALGAALLTAGGLVRPVYEPLRVVNRMVREGKVSRKEADTHDLAGIVEAEPFTGRPGSLTLGDLTVNAGDQMIFGAPGAIRGLRAGVQSTTARGLRDRLVGRGERSCATAVLSW